MATVLGLGALLQVATWVFVVAAVAVVVAVLGLARTLDL
jgi:hypothetical protein